MTNLARQLNASYQIYSSGDFLKSGERNPWRETNDLTVDLLAIKKRIITERYVDLLNTDEMVLNDDLSGITESLYPHDNDDIILLIHKGQKIPYYLYLFKVFKFELWCCVAGVIIFVLLWNIGIRGFIEWDTKIWDLLRAITSTSIPGFSSRWHSERIFLLFWILYSFILTLGFQSKLTSILMEPKYYPDMETLQDLDNSGIPILAYRTLLADLDQVLKGTSKYGLVKNARLMPSAVDQPDNTKNNFTQILRLPNPILLNSKRAIFITRLALAHRNGRPLFTIIKESPLPRFLAFQVTAGSPYLHQCNKIVRRFQESGFLIHWQQISDHEDAIKHILIPETRTKTKEKHARITLLHLQTAFSVLILGNLFSGIVLVFEHLWKRSGFINISGNTV